MGLILTSSKSYFPSAKLPDRVWGYVAVLKYAAAASVHMSVPVIFCDVLLAVESVNSLRLSKGSSVHLKN